MTVTKRHLRDLYAKGKEVTLTDGAIEEILHPVEGQDEEGNPLPPDVEVVELPAVVVYLKKINMNDNAAAIRKANAARARIIAGGRNPESDIYQSVYGDVLDSERDELIDILISPEAAKIAESASAEISSRDEWSKEGHLQGLVDAWEDGLKARLEEEPEDEEALRVKAELDRYEKEVNDTVKTGIEKLRRDRQDMSEDAILEEATKALIKVQGDTAWIDEYRKCEVFYATRKNENRDERYFESREEVDDIDPKILVKLLEEYRRLAVDVQEGKALQETPTS